LRHGTGALNIDGCRIKYASDEDTAAAAAAQRLCHDEPGRVMSGIGTSGFTRPRESVEPYLESMNGGRWPPNTVFTHSASCVCVGSRPVKSNPTWDTPNRETESTFTGDEVSRVQHIGESVPVWECAADCPVRALDEQSGSTGGSTANQHVDSGTASRFFPRFALDAALDDVTPFLYMAKPSRAERDAGLDDLRASMAAEATNSKEGQARLDSPRAGAGRTGGARNIHPTVKSVEQMRYFCRLVTPPRGVVLDFCCGSGTAGIGAVLEGFRFIGIELNDTEAEPFVTIARARIKHVIGGDYSKPVVPTAESKSTQGRLFG
jgi:hypothetical protein